MNLSVKNRVVFECSRTACSATRFFPKDIGSDVKMQDDEFPEKGKKFETNRKNFRI